MEQLIRFILKFRSADGTETDIDMALHEALANSAIHGNGENSCNSFTSGVAVPLLHGRRDINHNCDQGRGFDSSEVLDPTFLENLLFTHGRGIYLMKTLMDEVSFEEGGAVV